MSSTVAARYAREMAQRFPLAAQLSLTGRRIGQEGEPLLIVDGLLDRPGDLVAAAVDSTFLPAHGPAGGYPGLRAEAPLDYVEAVVRLLCPVLGEAFGLGKVSPVRAECNFSLVTLPPAALVAAQREPHVDTVWPLQFAVLHYLCGPEHGGTAFFRHRATGFETLSEARLPVYEQVRAGEGVADGYVGDGAPWFDRMDGVEAAFNRLVVYRSCLLHSGTIPDPAILSADPRNGRLTANIFLTVRQG